MVKNTSIKALIAEAVNAGLRAGRTQASSMAKNAFKATERRLYALPVLERKLLNEKEELEDTLKYGLRERSTSFVRFQQSGSRISPEEKMEAKVQDLTANIANIEYEIETVRRAMESFSDDPFYPAVTGRYIDRYTDEDIAADLDCGTTQVWKQRTRIVKDIAVLLYGVEAV